MRMLTNQGFKRFVLKNNETGETFGTLTAAAHHFGISRSNIQRQISGKLKTANGYTFRWIEASRKRRNPRRPERRKRIRCNETGRVFPSVRAAARWVGVHPSRISTHLTSGKPSTLDGRTFRYADAWDAPETPRPARHKPRPRYLYQHVGTGETFESCAKAAQRFGISAKSVHRGGTREHRFERYELTRDGNTFKRVTTADLFGPLRT